MAWFCALSSAALVTFTQPLDAHELRPTIADIGITQTRVTLKLILTLEPIIAGIDLEGLTDTNSSPLAGEHDELRALSADELAARFRAIWPSLGNSIQLKAGDVGLSMRIDKVEIPDVGNLDLPRDSVVSLSASLPPDNSAITLSWGSTFGLLALRQIGEGATYEALLAGGDISAALPRIGGVEQVFATFFVQYIKIGFQHIVPKGLDHILFVLGLFLFSATLRPMLWQVTTFTIAHTLTLALASLGIISVASSIVEPLIAASIIYVAVENIIGGKLTGLRLAVIFGFGLLHGLGFASVLGEVGLQPSRFLTGLIGFNIGVEIGQLVIILVAYIAVGFWFHQKPWYRRVVTIPASVLIGLIATYWLIERLFQ